jgi:hypothetical protein
VKQTYEILRAQSAGVGGSCLVDEKVNLLNAGVELEAVPGNRHRCCIEG